MRFIDVTGCRFLSASSARLARTTMPVPDVSRRWFVARVPLALIVAPASTKAQERGRVYRFGHLTSIPQSAPQYGAFVEELRRQGVTVEMDPRGFGQHPERFPAIARDLAAARVDVIICAGDAAIRAAQKATTTIPILGITDDMMGSGLVRSFVNPGGNTTGISLLATELDGKRQDLLIELVPGLRRMGALVDTHTTAARQLQALQDAARARGVELSLHRVAAPEGIAPAIEAARNSGAKALNVLASPLLFSNGRVIFDRAAALRLPAIYQWPEMAQGGGLVGFGPRVIQIFREMLTRQTLRLLHGRAPADLPVEQPTKLELVINLKTAKALGLTIPPSLLLRADHVIE
jgi:putative ABC transport system substrate-binding protein